MAGFTELEVQWLAGGGRISVRALARALGLTDHKHLHKIIEQELQDLEDCNELVVCLQDTLGIDEDTKEFFLSEGQCLILVARDEFKGCAVFAHFEGVVERWSDGDDEGNALARGRVH